MLKRFNGIFHQQFRKRMLFFEKKFNKRKLRMFTENLKDDVNVCGPNWNRQISLHTKWSCWVMFKSKRRINNKAISHFCWILFDYLSDIIDDNRCERIICVVQNSCNSSFKWLIRMSIQTVFPTEWDVFFCIVGIINMLLYFKRFNIRYNDCAISHFIQWINRQWNQIH